MKTQTVAENGIGPLVFQPMLLPAKRQGETPERSAEPPEDMAATLCEALATLDVCRYGIEVSRKKEQSLRDKLAHRERVISEKTALVEELQGRLEEALNAATANRKEIAQAQQRRASDVAENKVLRRRVSQLEAEAAKRGRHLTEEEAEVLLRRVRKAEFDAVQALMKASAMTKTESVVGKARNVAEVLKAAKISPALSIPARVAEMAVGAMDEAGKRKARAQAVGAALLSLHAYAIDGSRQGDFKQWLAAGGSGAKVSDGRVAMSESVSARRDERHAASRVFPVDRTLDTSGKRQMLAHIRLDNGPTAPRLYFLDDTRGETGKVHVGYIGPHLSTAHDPT